MLRSNIWRCLRVGLYTKKALLWMVAGCIVVFLLTSFLNMGEHKPEIPGFGGEQRKRTYSVPRNLIEPEDENKKAADVPKKNYTILFWNDGERMIRRFVRSYGAIDKDPFKHCSVRNCKYRIDGLKGLNESDAIVFHLHRIKGPEDVPPYRFPHQRWVFFTDESPRNTFYVAKKKSMKYYNGIFNWSMTYSSEADVPVPYGRTVELPANDMIQPSDLPNYFQLNSKTTAIVGSNCGGVNHRWDYVRELKKYTAVDVYGGCGNLKCPGGYMDTFCPLIRGYKFYLAFENCNCKEYITEKLWWNAFNNEAVPVVMGGSKDDYSKLCPPSSFIHVDDFANPQSLGQYLNYLSQNETSYNLYFQWKSTRKVLNEHGYFHTDTMHICHLCEALNNPSKPPKVYNDLENYWSRKSACRDAKWKPS